MGMTIMLRTSHSEHEAPWQRGCMPEAKEDAGDAPSRPTAPASARICLHGTRRLPSAREPVDDDGAAAAAHRWARYSQGIVFAHDLPVRRLAAGRRLLAIRRDRVQRAADGLGGGYPALVSQNWVRSIAMLLGLDRRVGRRIWRTRSILAVRGQRDSSKSALPVPAATNGISTSFTSCCSSVRPSRSAGCLWHARRSEQTIDRFGPNGISAAVIAFG